MGCAGRRTGTAGRLKPQHALGLLIGGEAMPDLTLWGLFVVASLVLLLTSGPAVLYIVARSVQQGRTAGLVSVLGIHLGTLVHITAAAIGPPGLLGARLRGREVSWGGLPDLGG